ncbi:MAG: hypothetical protein WC589_00480 [Sphingobacterium sp.]
MKFILARWATTKQVDKEKFNVKDSIATSSKQNLTFKRKTASRLSFEC